MVATLLVSAAACSGSDAVDTTVPPSATSAPSSTLASGPDCESAREVATAFDDIDLSDRARLEALPARLDDLAAQVPEDLAADAEVVAATFGQLVDVLATHDFDLAAIQADPEAQRELGALSDPALVASTERLGQWIDESCA